MNTNKKGYVLVYALIAMMVGAALVLSTVSVSLCYNNNVIKKIGARGALYASQAGLAGTENYLNAFYADKGNLKTSESDLWATLYDCVNEIVPITETESQNDKALLVLQGYVNYNYVMDSETLLTALNPEPALNVAYKTYLAVGNYNGIDYKAQIKSSGIITLLSVGEYVCSGKTYYKYITFSLNPTPIYGVGNVIQSFKLNPIKYSETIEGGTNVWGKIQW